MTEKPLSAVEKVKEESHGLRGDLAPQLAAGGDHFSDASAQLLKFHGTYQQEELSARVGEMVARSEEHTSELQSRPHLVCRLLLEKKKKKENKDNEPLHIRQQPRQS